MTGTVQTAAGRSMRPAVGARPVPGHNDRTRAAVHPVWADRSFAEPASGSPVNAGAAAGLGYADAARRGAQGIERSTDGWARAPG